MGKVAGANLALRRSIPIYVTVKGTEKYDFEIKDINVTNKNFAMLKIKMVNRGNVHIRPTGSIYIEALGAEQKYDLKFNDIKWGIIANQAHEYITKLPDDPDDPTDQRFKDGTYKAYINIMAGDKKNRKEWSGEILFKIKGDSGEIIRGFDK